MKSAPVKEIWKVTARQESPKQVKLKFENETTSEVLGTFYIDLDPKTEDEIITSRARNQGLN